MKLSFILFLFSFVLTNFVIKGLFLPSDSHLKISLSRTKRIIGGSRADTKNFPYVVLLYNMYPLGDVHICGGTIISPDWVLTTANCVIREPLKIFVLTAADERSALTKDDVHEVNETIFHPKKRRNVALLRLEDELEFGCNINSVNLPEPSYTVPERQTATTLGWGVAEKGSIYSSISLRKVNVEIIPDDECDTASIFEPKRRTHLCTLSDTSGPCHGDGGGPLVIKGDILVGVISAGPVECVSTEMAQTYVNVPKCRKWITSVTGI